ncbi:MAG: FKBP-type peptidyl-prolyl cis-trans isomerase [Elusimicrobia bacterium]|nr:FKBP-type peptidyl-prolyl cis-trans isomerase [Elusimicrobiota bacterium]
MNKIVLAVLAVTLPAGLMAQTPAPATGTGAAPAAVAVPFDTQGGLFANDDQKTLYFLGTAVSSKIKQLGFTTEESKYIIMGFSDTMNGEKTKVDESYGQKLNEYLGKKQLAMVNKEKEKNKPFVEAMSKEKGAQKLASGVVYIPVTEGTGAAPKATDMVKVHYHGTFPDGKVFDSSVDRGTPAEFPLNGVIPCWTEGVQKMKVGGKAKLICPSDTAYGDQGAGGAIPGGATLVFDVQLLEILKPAVAVGENPAKAAKPVKVVKPAAVKPAAKPAK